MLSYQTMQIDRLRLTSICVIVRYTIFIGRGGGERVGVNTTEIRGYTCGNNNVNGARR